MEEILNATAALLAVVAGAFGLIQYARIRTRRDKQRAVGEAFAGVVAGLGSDVSVERLANAVVARRFFDPKSELGEGKTPYARSMVHVISALLRTEPTGPMQKLLGDGLAFAPDLRRADFQRVNLRDCYWGRDSLVKGVDATGADFHRADLTMASLKNAKLTGAVFKDAALVRTVLRGADCRGAIFEGADLKGANFHGAHLGGATFEGASHIPDAIAAKLDGESKFTGEVVDDPDAAERSMARGTSVFISAPSITDDSDAVALDQISVGIAAAGLLPVRHLPAEYVHAAPLHEIAQLIGKCDAVVVFGPPQLDVREGQWRKGPDHHNAEAMLLPSPWNQIEAGMAAALGKPILMVKRRTKGGVVDLSAAEPHLAVIDLAAPGTLANLAASVTQWCRNAIEPEPATPGTASEATGARQPEAPNSASTTLGSRVSETT